MFYTNIYQSQEINTFENPNKLFHSTPSISSLFRNDNFRASNLQNGTVDISIPLFEIKFNGISIPIAVNYITSGIKVDQQASNVGLGWSLNYGGSIIRNVNDLPDDEINVPYIHIPDDTGDNAGYNVKDVVALGYHRNVKEIKLDYYEPVRNVFKIDGAPDFYNVIAPGLSTQFLILQNENTVSDNFSQTQFVTKNVKGDGAKILPPSAKTINLSAFGFSGVHETATQAYLTQPIQSFDSFEIQYNGFVYKFNYGNIQESLLDYKEGIDNTWGWIANHKKQVNSWDLQEITDLKSGKKLTYNYEVYNKAVEDFSYNLTNLDLDVNNDTAVNTDFEYEINSQYTYENGAPYIKKRYFYSKNRYKYPRATRVSKIIYDEGEVVFIYNNNRIDEPGEKELNKIIIKDKNSNVVKEIEFIYSYKASKENCSDYYCYRMFLDKISFNYPNQNNNEVYQFSYDERKLPNRKFSLEKDYLGFYNNNGSGNYLVNDNIFFRHQYSPKLYYYPENKEFSILPFKRNDILSYKFINGSISLEPNEYSRASILKKVVFPTKGYLELEYENNSFHYKGYNYNLGGARIKSQNLYDFTGTLLKKTTYEYIDNNGFSSGRLLYAPLYGFPTNSISQSDIMNGNFNNIHFYTFLSDQSNITSKNVFYYEKVTEKINGGKIENYFGVNKHIAPSVYTVEHYNQTSNVEKYKKDFLINNSGFTNLDYNEERIHNIKKIFYNNNTKIKEINTKHKIISVDSINTITYKTYALLFLGTHYGYLNPVFNMPSSIDVLNSNLFTNNFTNNIKPISIPNESIGFNAKIFFGDYKESEIDTFNILNNNILKTNTKNDYSTLDIIKLMKQTAEFPDSTIQETVYQYAHEKGNQYLIDQNIVGIPLQTTVTKTANGSTKILSDVETKYPISQTDADTKTSSLPLPYEVISNDYHGNSNKEVSYKKYDNKGNLQEYVIKPDVNGNGIPVTIIWGYNQTQPLAKIEGATLSQVMTALNISDIALADIVVKSNADIDQTSEDLLITSLDAFRNNTNLKNFQISTYTYNPLIGVTSITPPSGVREIYKYDSANRLQSVVDVNGNILKEYNYNFQSPYYNLLKTQSFTRNNCGTGYTGGTYIYTVPAGKYSSMVSQADADNQAQAEINSNGQNEANTNGLCIGTSCYVSFNYLLGINGGGGVSVMNNINYKLTFGFSSGANSSNLPWTSSGVKIATINGNCRPKIDYSSYNGQVYYTIKTNGDVILRTHSILPNNTSYNYVFYFPIN